jgi:hypothetical protein
MNNPVNAIDPLGLVAANDEDNCILEAGCISRGGMSDSVAYNNLPALPKQGEECITNRTVIGKVKDLSPDKLASGEASLLNRLPNRGTPKANWKQNSGVLRSEMNKGAPIRDASVDGNGNLINNNGFLQAERSLLLDRGWSYNPDTQLWSLPK